MSRNPILPYRPELRGRARELRRQGILGEVLLWKELRGRRFGCQFHRQVPIGNYIVDFFCHELMLAIEVDGWGHTQEDKSKYDLERQTELERMGIHVVRFWETDVRHDMRGVLYVLEGIIHEKMGMCKE